jgi:hypothetical protein
MDVKTVSKTEKLTKYVILGCFKIDLSVIFFRSIQNVFTITTFPNTTKRKTSISN